MTSKDKYSHFLNLLDLPRKCELKDLDEFIGYFIRSKSDQNKALQDLDQVIGGLSNFILLFSIHLKQNHLLAGIQEKGEKQDIVNYTKQEVAKKFKVNRRTVTNWIYAGLKTTEIGGVCRISESSLEEFIKSHHTKKFAWRSNGNMPYKKAS